MSVPVDEHLPLQEGVSLKGEHLYALDIRLRAKTAGYLQMNAGQEVQAALLGWFADVDPALASSLHEPDQRRPFTCSCLFAQSQERSWGYTWIQERSLITPGQTYQLRFTLLSEMLFRSFMDRYLSPTNRVSQPGEPLSLPQIRLGKVLFDVIDIFIAPPSGEKKKQAPSWGAHTTYQRLVEEARKIDGEKRQAYDIGFQFCSPTMFKGGTGKWRDRTYCFPAPEYVFDSLARTWNLWAPAHSHIDHQALRRYCMEWVDIADYRIQTQLLRTNHGEERGFVGFCLYRLMERNTAPFLSVSSESPEQKKDLSSELSGVQILSLLQEFSFFSAIGAKTAMGMGQAYPFKSQLREA